MRKELTQLLDNILEHSNRYTDERAIPSLEVGAVLTKISRLQEGMSVLRYLLEEREKLAKQRPRKDATNFDVKIVVDQSESLTTEEKPAEAIESVVEPEPQVQVETETQVINFDQPSIAKLSDALTLNDRYLFANELFEKDMNAFNELVKSVDSCLSLNEAKALLIPLSWDDENEHAISFSSLVERRFL